MFPQLISQTPLALNWPLGHLQMINNMNVLGNIELLNRIVESCMSVWNLLLLLCPTAAMLLFAAAHKHPCLKMCTSAVECLSYVGFFSP